MWPFTRKDLKEAPDAMVHTCTILKVRRLSDGTINIHCSCPKGLHTYRLTPTYDHSYRAPRTD